MDDEEPIWIAPPPYGAERDVFAGAIGNIFGIDVVETREPGRYMIVTDPKRRPMDPMDEELVVLFPKESKESKHTPTFMINAKPGPPKPLAYRPPRAPDIDHNLRDRTFVCPACQWESWNPNDLAQGYCGHCHAFTCDHSVCCPTHGTHVQPTTTPHVGCILR